MQRLTAGLDQQIKIFSPSGDLHQIDYAQMAVASENTTVALKTIHTAVVATQKRIADKTIVPQSLKYLFATTPRVGCCATGRIADARYQQRWAINEASKFRYTFGYDISARVLCERLADMNQIYSMHSEIRSLGCSIILIDYDGEGRPTVHMTEPTGEYNSYKGCALGPNADKAEAYLEQHLQTHMSEEKSLQLAIDCLSTAMDIEFEPLHLEVGVVSKAHPEFRMLDANEIASQLYNIARQT
ncbi:proteasome subunit alpha type-6-like [Drosophila madeirensis]|uniref:Proteasome subunit alpha type-6-like n=1 Tax=Drosophila madeirensis TaxID=30013 RepID=A0AAU9FJ27_DROMD